MFYTIVECMLCVLYLTDNAFFVCRRAAAGTVLSCRTAEHVGRAYMRMFTYMYIKYIYSADTYM